MELMTEEKKGFKKTEVGLIPQEWKVEKIKNIASIVRGGSPRPAGDPKFFGGQFIPWLTVGSLTQIPDTQQKVFETKGYLTEEGSKRSRILEPGTLIISNSGATLGVAKILGIKCCANDGIAALNDIGTGISTEFLTYYLNSITDHLRNVVAMGVGQRNLNTNRIGELSFPFPPTLEEQQAIATALSDVDELIRCLDRLIEKKEAIKKGTMQQLLSGKKRLPGFDGEWEVISLKQLTDRSFELFNDGDWVESDHIIDQGIRLLQTGNVGVGNFKQGRNKKYINEDSFRKLNCKEVKVGDLLICRLADPPGRACIVPDINEDKMITSVDVSILRPKESEVDKHFLLQVFSTTEWFDEVNEKCGGTTRTRISRSALGNIELNIPSYEEQKAIGTIFKDMDRELQTLRQKREKMRRVKEGMMQELLTGKTRLV